MEQHPIHVACQWIGNSPAVASKHYLQVNEYHFQKATQNPTQLVAEGSRKVSQDETEKSCNDGSLRECARSGETLQSAKAGPGRTCTHAPTGSKTPISQSRVAESDALDARGKSVDARLARLNQIWPELPEHIRQAIEALVHSP